MFLIRIQVFWGQLRAQRASACPNIHEWCTQPAHVRCSVAQLMVAVLLLLAFGLVVTTNEPLQLPKLLQPRPHDWDMWQTFVTFGYVPRGTSGTFVKCWLLVCTPRTVHTPVLRRTEWPVFGCLSSWDMWLGQTVCKIRQSWEHGLTGIFSAVLHQQLQTAEFEPLRFCRRNMNLKKYKNMRVVMYNYAF
jgi:hypothetical protein